MSIKKLSSEGRFECGLDDIVRGKVWAFVCVTGKHNTATLGVAVANQRGYHPIPETWAHSDDWRAMEDHADELNKAEGKSPEDALRIVCSTMQQGAEA